MKIGDTVTVKREHPGSIVKPAYPGRVGQIVRQNQFGAEQYGGLWYVRLEATARARAREICIHGCDLELKQ